MSEESFIDLAEHIEESLDGAVTSHEFLNGELILNAKGADIVRIIHFLRDDKECDFKILVDICGVDYPDRPNTEERFEVVYNLLSLQQNQRVRVKVAVGENMSIPSVTSMFSSAGWFEREAWDMYGIYFEGNHDLRRILTDYGFEGHPLRKDFPLTGYTEVRYDEELRRVVYEPVSLPQDFRNFDSVSPWEGMTDVQIPGDDKQMKPEHGYTDYRGKKAS
jgi:NADH-quinone oxidoreductase subunit C